MNASSRLRPTSVLAVLTVAFAAACSVNPTAQEVVDRSTPPICEKAKECAAASFALTYAGGVDECVTKTKSEVAKKYGSDLEKSSVCTDDELDACIKDLKASACPPGEALPQIPCKC
jgi:hypothetical protein